MKFLNRLKEANILTVDVWVLVTLFILIPKTETLTGTATQAYTLGAIILILSILFGAIVLLCSKLRGYRYLDFYINCKKISDNFIKWTLVLCIIALVLIIIWYGANIIPIVVKILFIYCLSLHLNTTKKEGE